MVFPRQNLPLPCRPFPFNPSAQVLPDLNTRLPLSPYCNPLPAQLRQPRCFPQQNAPTLSLFCKHGFQRQYRAASGHYAFPADPLSPAYSLKAGYTARSTRFCAPPCRFIPGSYASGSRKEAYRRRTIPGLHGNRVGYSMPLECARDP